MDLPQSHLRTTRRRGVTLLELLVVVTLMGTLSTVVVTHYGRDIFSDMGARSDAHRLWLDMQHAKALAIRNGNSFSVVFQEGSGGSLAGYRIDERTATGGQKTVGEPSTFSSDIRVTATATAVDFTFEGNATTACSVNLQGPNRTWALNVVPLSGSVRISEVSP